MNDGLSVSAVPRAVEAGSDRLMARQRGWRQRVAALRTSAQTELHRRFMAKGSFESASAPDREATLSALRNGELTLEHATAQLRADRDVVLAAMQNDLTSLKHASAELRADREFVLAATLKNPFAVTYASHALRADHDFVLTAANKWEEYLKSLGLGQWTDLAFHVSAMLQSDSAKIRLTRDRDALGAAVGVKTLPAPHAALEAAPEALAIVYSLIAQRVAIVEANCAAAIQARRDNVLGGRTRRPHDARGLPTRASGSGSPQHLLSE